MSKILTADEIDTRKKFANEFADMIIDNKKSIREVAKFYGISKSTVHNYITEYTTGAIRKLRLTKQLRENYTKMHIKGGKATALKYEKKRMHRVS